MPQTGSFTVVGAAVRLLAHRVLLVRAGHAGPPLFIGC
jgi:hypothetical protein